MSTPTAQRNWQFRLSTAIALVLVAGVLIGVNLRDRHRRLQFNSEGGILKQYGWPWVVYEVIDPALLYPDTGGLYTGVEGMPSPRRLPLLKRDLILKWDNPSIFANALVAVGLLGVTVVFSEWLRRRREGRKA